MLETTPWVLHPFTLILRTCIRISLKSRVCVVGRATTIKYPSRRTEKKMNDESKQHGAVIGTTDL